LANEKKRAGEGLLAELHNLTAKQMLTHIKDTMEDPEKELTASYLSVVIKFLKDNGIEALPESSDELRALAKNLPDLEDYDREHYTQQ
jgi:hypothetical protein